MDSLIFSEKMTVLPQLHFTGPFPSPVSNRFNPESDRNSGAHQPCWPTSCFCVFLPKILRLFPKSSDFAITGKSALGSRKDLCHSQRQGASHAR